MASVNLLIISAKRNPLQSAARLLGQPLRLRAWIMMSFLQRAKRLTYQNTVSPTKKSRYSARFSTKAGILITGTLMRLNITLISICRPAFRSTASTTRSRTRARLPGTFLKRKRLRVLRAAQLWGTTGCSIRTKGCGLPHLLSSGFSFNNVNNTNTNSNTAAHLNMFSAIQTSPSGWKNSFLKQQALVPNWKMTFEFSQ